MKGFMELSETCIESTTMKAKPKAGSEKLSERLSQGLPERLPERLSKSIDEFEASVESLEKTRRSAWSRAIDLVYLCLSWGAFSRTELKPQHHEHEGHEHADLRVVRVMRRICAVLEKTHEPELDQMTHDEAMKGWMLALLLLSGDCGLSVKELELFKQRCADVESHSG